jgi:outer membrane murein-binding lipoprotein Lpp
MGMLKLLHTVLKPAPVLAALYRQLCHYADLRYINFMTEATDNLVLEHLRHIRGRVDQIAEDMSDLKSRMSSLESGMVLVKREVSMGDETDARQQVSLDKILERIQRIERRLELS